MRKKTNGKNIAALRPCGQKARGKPGQKARGAALRPLLFLAVALIAFAGAMHADSASASAYNYFWLALLIPIAVVAIAYMASYAFNTPALRAVLQDELVQILATGAVALTLVGTQMVVDEYATAALNAGSATPSANIEGAMGAAAEKAHVLENEASSRLTNMLDVSKTLGQEASKGVFCNFMGVGFSLNNCSPFNAYRGSLTAAAFANTVALSDSYAQGFIFSLARAYAFSIIIPLGLLFRCFKATRGAGGALIAIGFGFYTVYPVVTLATDNLLVGSSAPPSSVIPTVGSCNPKDPSVANALSEFTDYGSQLTDYNLIYGIAYQVMVRVIFLSILNLIITLTFIRTFAHMIGSEIDVSSLARVS